MLGLNDRLWSQTKNYKNVPDYKLSFRGTESGIILGGFGEVLYKLFSLILDYNLFWIEVLLEMSNDHLYVLQNENSQSFKYDLQEMNFNTNFEHINEGQCNSFWSSGVMEANNKWILSCAFFPKSLNIPKLPTFRIHH